MLSLPRNNARPVSAEALFAWSSDSYSNVTADRTLTEDVAVEAGDFIDLIDFEADRMAKYSHHLQKYSHKKCFFVYNNEQNLFYEIDCEEEFIRGAEDCV